MSCYFKETEFPGLKSIPNASDRNNLVSTPDTFHACTPSTLYHALQSPSICILDVRPPSTCTHFIQHAIPMGHLPTTLLKRTSFPLDKLLTTFLSPYHAHLLLNPLTTCIILYDQGSSIKTDTSLLGMVWSRLKRETLADVVWLQGGFNSFQLQFPHVCQPWSVPGWTLTSCSGITGDTSIQWPDYLVHFMKHTNTRQLEQAWLRLHLDETRRRQETEYSVSVGLQHPQLNRYPDILPFDKNRVKLSSDEYMNASWITVSPCHTIATQCPLDSTRDTFWQMVDQQECHVILMLNPDTPDYLESCHIRILSRHCLSHIQLTTLLLKSQGKGSLRLVHHVQYLGWPDKGLPHSLQDIITLQHIVSVLRQSTPIVVHCSGGCGRTGVYMALDHVLSHPGHVDVMECIQELKRQRMFMVHTFIQFIYCYYAVSHLRGNDCW